jgi:putative SOS response-associated peptidase YedK
VCGRYDISETQVKIVLHFGLDRCPEFAPGNPARPTERLVVVRRAPDAKNEGVLLRWGLVPAFAKDLSYGTKFAINARAETIDMRVSFREAFRARRCLVPARAYYEGSSRTGRRQVFRVALKNGDLMGMAGLWESWKGLGGETVETYTVITTSANALVAQYTDKADKRMPVILHPKDYDFWLDPSNRDFPALKALLRPFPAEEMIVTPALGILADRRLNCLSRAAPSSAICRPDRLRARS